MATSLEESSGKRLGVKEKSRLGRIIVLVSIASIIAIIAVFFFLSTSIRFHQYLFRALIILTCCQLYMGSIWARWVIGFILVIYGAYSTFQLMPVSDIRLTPMLILLILLTLVSLISGIGLILSKGVPVFLNEQFSNRNILVIRVLKALWILLLMGFLILFYQDITRIFFS